MRLTLILLVVVSALLVLFATGCDLPPPPVCGDDVCQAGIEDSVNSSANYCSADCTGLCGDGVCLGDETPNNCGADCPVMFCDDPDGNNPNIKGTTYFQPLGNVDPSSFTDRCIDNSSVTEYICNNDEVSVESINCEQGCLDGACVPEPVPNTCTDSDGGLADEIYIAGRTTGVMNGRSYDLSDECLSRNSGTLIAERKCIGPNWGYEEVTCPCSERACIPNQTNST